MKHYMITHADTCCRSMSLLLSNVTNSIWHAFNALTSDKPGAVMKSKLKVLTANIGTLLDLYGVEKGLEHYRSTADLNFEHYRYYLQKEVFSSLPDTTLSAHMLRRLQEKIDEVCWLVCRKQYLEPAEHQVFDDHCVYKLFRIFCMLAELVPDNTGIPDCFQVLLHVSEASSIATQLVMALGLPEIALDSLPSLRFPTFLAVLEVRCGDDSLDQGGIDEAVTELYHTYLYDVLKKGFLMRRGYLLPTLREYWFVLQPNELSYYKGQDEKEHCGSITLDTHCRVDVCSSSGKDKVQRFFLHTGERSFELGAPDHRSRLQWVSALQTAIAHSSGTGYQRLQARRRRQQRESLEISRRTEEIRRCSSHLQDMEQTRAQLQAEKMARVAAESQARALEAVHKEEERKLQELEDIRSRLEKLLEEETQAKRDEEIVRNLQARVLREEWEKREELEQLQEEQRALLEQEREKRREFEEIQRQKEAQLLEAEERLKQLEEERLQLDRELGTARDKIMLSEKSKEVLEAKLRVMAPHVRESDRVRRALSFMPSTKERPSIVSLRSHSLRRTSQDSGHNMDRDRISPS